MLKEKDKITEKDEDDVIIDDNNNDVHMANDEEIYYNEIQFLFFID